MVAMLMSPRNLVQLVKTYPQQHCYYSRALQQVQIEFAVVYGKGQHELVVSHHKRKEFASLLRWQNLVGEENSHLVGVKIHQEYIVEVERLLDLHSLAVA
ncbi:hypothetical protein AT3G59295 [Arabidopsis thaliana]|uniref:Uncharacterized protein n=1 Tax=Arabidopsis thaliana TaxID=3702 RepID=A0A1I9LPV1_ARATH|nr:uncharacterized protein AT3G59295 [Arabidopsis thaliana]ANM64609.1 hypothetical protein AT3G59295 [Arabidopsis thaliana]|eukprot:NP_001326625.1 hypothetical protein AT3G59295 [Arabidopsis thaliana]